MVNNPLIRDPGYFQHRGCWPLKGADPGWSLARGLRRLLQRRPNGAGFAPWWVFTKKNGEKWPVNRGPHGSGTTTNKALIRALKKT